MYVYIYTILVTKQKISWHVQESKGGAWHVPNIECIFLETTWEGVSWPGRNAAALRARKGLEQLSEEGASTR